MTIELLFLIDIGVCFFVEYRLDDNVTMERNVWKTATRYLKTYFIVDIIASIPFNFLLMAFEQKNGYEFLRLLLLLKFLRIRKVMLLVKPEVFKYYINTFYKQRLASVIRRAKNNTINLDPKVDNNKILS